jgi:hypothetical protein
MVADFEERTPVLAARIRYLQAQITLQNILIKRLQNWAVAVSTVTTLAAMTGIAALAIIVAGEL